MITAKDARSLVDANDKNVSQYLNNIDFKIREVAKNGETSLVLDDNRLILSQEEHDDGYGTQTKTTVIKNGFQSKVIKELQTLGFKIDYVFNGTWSQKIKISW